MVKYYGNFKHVGGTMITKFSKGLFKHNMSSVIIKKRTLQRQIDIIINNMPENLSEIEIIRYIYLNLGKLLVSNTNYSYNLNFEKRHNIFINGKNSPIPQTNEIICNSGSELLTYTLKKLGVNAETYYNIGIDHAETIVNTLDNKLYCLNLIGDLSRIHTNRKTKYFAESSDTGILNAEIKLIYQKLPDSLSDEELKKIDDKIGYTFHGLYTDDFISMLKKEFVDNFKYIMPSDLKFENEYDKNEKMRKYALEFLINNCNILNEDLSSVGFEETTHYYWNLIRNVLPKQNINLYSCFFDGKISNKEMISIISLPYKNSYIYYLYDKNYGKYIEISKDHIEKLLKHGLKVNANKTIAGFDIEENIEK